MIKQVWIVAIFAILLTAKAAGQKTSHHSTPPDAFKPTLIEKAFQGDARAQAEVTRRAENGDRLAQRALADNYTIGRWTPKDNAEALRWYRKAADQGDLEARQIIASMYQEGKFEDIKVKRDFDEAARWYACPKPAGVILAGCTETTYEELPRGAVDLLLKMKCDVARKMLKNGSPYDYGSAVDLSGKGTPAYEICCGEEPHGPCSAVVIGKVGGQWKELSGKDWLEGFGDACNGLIVLESQHNGFHDICLPYQCSPLAPIDENSCAPTIWQFHNGHYRSITDTPATPQP